MRHLPLIAALLFTTPAYAVEELTLPAPVVQQVKQPLDAVGSGRYRKLGFSVYDAKLWAPGGEYAADKTHVLQVHYLRDLDKETVVEAVVDDIRAQKPADDATLAEWERMLTETLPAVKDGDEIIGLSVPGKPAKLYHNGKQIASISDQRLAKAFFNIWLGDVANEDLREKLLGGA